MDSQLIRDIAQWKSVEKWSTRGEQDNAIKRPSVWKDPRVRDDDQKIVGGKVGIEGRGGSGDGPTRPGITEEKSFIESGSTVGNGQHNTESMLLDDDRPVKLFYLV